GTLWRDELHRGTAFPSFEGRRQRPPVDRPEHPGAHVPDRCPNRLLCSQGICQRRLTYKRPPSRRVTYQQQISLKARGHGQMHDLTAQVAAIVTSSEIKNGLVNVFNVGSTAAIGTIEFEPG